VSRFQKRMMGHAIRIGRQACARAATSNRPSMQRAIMPPAGAAFMSAQQDAHARVQGQPVGEILCFVGHLKIARVRSSPMALQRHPHGLIIHRSLPPVIISGPSNSLCWTQFRTVDRYRRSRLFYIRLSTRPPEPPTMCPGRARSHRKVISSPLGGQGAATRSCERVAHGSADSVPPSAAPAVSGGPAPDTLDPHPPKSPPDSGGRPRPKMGIGAARRIGRDGHKLSGPRVALFNRSTAPASNV
jgi:hypothetical protein